MVTLRVRQSPTEGNPPSGLDSPTREWVVVADSSFAALELLAAVSQRDLPIHMITRLRLDAALYTPAPLRLPGTMGRPRLKGSRLPNLEQVLVNPKTQWLSVTLNRRQW